MGVLAKFLVMILLPFSVWAGKATDSLSFLPIQDSGRLKPFDTFAKEQLRMVYGKITFENKPANEIIMTWVLQPQAWEEKPIFEIKYHLLKKALRLPETQKYFSPKEILSSDRLSTVIQELQSQREAKIKLDPYFQAVQRLETQLFIFKEIAGGRMLRFVPPKEGDAWLGLPDLAPPLQEAFVDMTKAFVPAISPNAGAAEEEALKASIEKFKGLAQAENPGLYPSDKVINLEVHYNVFHPFRQSATAYFFSAIFFILFWIFKKRYWIPAGWALSWIGLGLHVYGFAIRTILTERAPVTNMYETVIWVGFGAVVFAMVIEWLYKWNFVLAAGAAVAAFCLLLGDFAPAVLDASLQPLEPVLRDNFWLTTHVMTITVSYAAFFLAFALGDVGLVMSLNEEKYKEQIKAIVLSIYRCVQIGVAFLAPGIILGGIWADYSWGRFWGWDPKETWALIALLGYLAMLHGRLAGILKNFGMIATAVITFSLVIMAWYGVNFVLGAGLHSYGFGAGGVEYVAAFVVAHFVFVTYVAVARTKKA